MRRFSLLTLLALLMAITGVLAARGAGASASTVLAAQPGVPAVPCSFTPLTFGLSGTGSAGASRAIAISVGDSFPQFVALPITATSASQAYVTVNDTFSGTVSGGLAGTFDLRDLNGLLMTAAEGFLTGTRGIDLQRITIVGAGGAITAALGINVAGPATPPYYPRIFNGYLHSLSTSGVYAPYKFQGTIAGTIGQGSNGLTLDAQVAGRLYSGGAALNETLTALRTAPAARASSFQSGDVVAQFTRPDLPTGAVAGHVNPANILLGSPGGTITGTFALQSGALALDGGANSGKGWLAGQFALAPDTANILGGIWLSDLTSTNLSGYAFQVIGTGIYSNSLLFASTTGQFTLGTIFTGGMSGVFCDATALSTPTPGPSSTPAPSQTPGGPTVTPTEPGVTPTPCAISFSDVPPGSTFYAYVRCLACRGILGGYSDGTFRPGNNITRGQLAKIVSNSAAFSDPPGAQLYEDVPPTNTFFDFVQRLSHRGVMGGYACGGAGEPCVPPGNLPYFRPNNNATRGQISKIDVNAGVIALGWTLLNPPNNTFEDVPTGSTFFEYIETALAHGVMGGYACGAPPAGPCVPPANKPYFLPNNNATRGQTAKIVANTFFPACETPDKR